MWWLTEGAEYRERYYGISKDDTVGAFIKHTTGTYQSQLKTPWNSRPGHQHVAQLYIALAVNMIVIFFFLNFCLMFSIPRQHNDLSISNYFDNSMKKKMFAADTTSVWTTFILYNSTSLSWVQLMSPSFFFLLVTILQLQR